MPEPRYKPDGKTIRGYLARVQVRGVRYSEFFPAREHKTPAACKRAAARWEDDQRDHVRPIAGDTPCKKLVDTWLANYPRPKASTNEHNEMALRAFVREFGTTRANDLDRLTARQFWGKHQGAAVVARTMFNDLLRDDVVDRNPFDNMKQDGTRGKKDADLFSPDELNALIAAALKVHGPEYGPHFAGLLEFSAEVGLRKGELLALDRDDIDMQSMEVEVSKNLDRRGRITTPKNGKTRVMVLSPQARAAVLRMPTRIGERRLALNKHWKPISYTGMNSLWYPVRLKADLQDRRWHALRHTAATRLWELSMRHPELRISDWDICQQMGWSDPKLLWRVYGHPNAAAARERIKLLGRTGDVVPLRALDAREESA